MAVFQELHFHIGEEKIHSLTGVPPRDNPMNPMLTPRAAQQITIYPLMALGTIDPHLDNRPWTTLWGGAPPFAQQVARGGIIGIRTTIDASFDPVANVLVGNTKDGEVIRQTDGKGAMVSALSIGLEQRSRVKLYGRMIAGALSANEATEATDTALDDPTQGTAGNVQLVLKIEQSLGNCPKYLNKKVITPYPEARPRLASTNPHLCEEAIELVHNSDMFFVSSAHEFEDMDTNHRGGPPGFLRVQPRSDGDTGTVVVWPEYSGNNLYQTLGNLMTTPRAGIVIPNFETGDVLYLTGDTEVLVNEAASSVIAKTKLAVRFTTVAARFVKDGLGFRGKPVEDHSQGRSPYNPRLRFLTSEKQDKYGKDYGKQDVNQTEVTAKLVQSTKLSPTITKYRFSLSDPLAYGPWQPGQHVALDFSTEMDLGYSHMRDDDPTSLNDDFIRTFTVASPPNSLGIHGEEFDVMVRTVGTATQWLTSQRPGLVEIGIRGFGGEFKFENPGVSKSERGNRKGVFIAAGIGITPLLGQLGVVQNLKTTWTISGRDIGVVAEVLQQCSQEIKAGMTVFLTGSLDDMSAENEEKLKKVEDSGVRIEKRRMTKEDLSQLEGQVDDWYLCTAPAMRKVIQDWLPGKTIVYENFDY